MATTTTNIGLTKPGANENVNLVTINGNYDLIDTAIGALGTPSSANNLYSLVRGYGPYGFSNNVTNPTNGFNTVVDGLTTPYITTAGKTIIKAIMSKIVEMCEGTTISNNTIGNYIITAASDNCGGAMIYKQGPTYYSGIYMPLPGLTYPVSFRRYSTNYYIRVLA